MIKNILLCLTLFCTSAVHADQVKLLGLFSQLAIFSSNGDQFALRKGEEKNDVSLQNIELPKGQVTIMHNGRIKNISLLNRSGAKKEVIEADENRLYYTYGKINNKDVILLIDTGASHVTMNAVQAKRLNIDYKKGVQVQSVTASGIHPAYALRLKSVTIGKITVKNIAALVMDGSMPKTILLGMTFLEKIKLYNEGNMMTLSQVAP